MRLALARLVLLFVGASLLLVLLGHLALVVHVSVVELGSLDALPLLVGHFGVFLGRRAQLVDVIRNLVLLLVEVVLQVLILEQSRVVSGHDSRFSLLCRVKTAPNHVALVSQGIAELVFPLWRLARALGPLDSLRPRVRTKDGLPLLPSLESSSFFFVIEQARECVIRTCLIPIRCIVCVFFGAELRPKKSTIDQAVFFEDDADLGTDRTTLSMRRFFIISRSLARRVVRLRLRFVRA